MKLYRKLTAICLTAALAVGMAVTASADVSPVSVTVNGETASTSAYINSDWRTMVPAETAKALGVDYSVQGNSVTFTAGGISQTYTVGEAAGDTVPAMVNGTIYVPFYHLAETFGYDVSWNSAAGKAEATASSVVTVNDIQSIQAYTDETFYGTGLVEVEVTYRPGVDLSNISASSYILEDRGSLNPDFGQIKIAGVSVNGRTVTLTIDDGSAATSRNALVYSGNPPAGVRERNAFGIYCTGAWYRDVNGTIYFGSADTAEYKANTTKMGYQARECLELKLRHAGEAPGQSACLADDQGRYNADGLWKETVDRQFGVGKFQSFADLGIQIPSTAAAAADGTRDAYVKGYAYIPANYNPANGIVFTLQGQGISYWQLPDGTNDDGTGIMYDSATTSWANKGAVVVNIHDRSSAGKGDYESVYDYVLDDVNTMKYFIDKYNIQNNIVLQGNSRGTNASSTVIQALAGQEYTVNSNASRGTNQLDKNVYNFEVDTFICQNGMFGRNIYDQDDYTAIAKTDMRVWIFDGEQDTNNTDTYASYIQAAQETGHDDAWIKENIRLTSYPSELYYYWGETDHSTTRINGWYFDDTPYYGAGLDVVDGKIVYHTQLEAGDTYTVQGRGVSRDGAGPEKTEFTYTVYGEQYQDWALNR